MFLPGDFVKEKGVAANSAKLVYQHPHIRIAFLKNTASQGKHQLYPLNRIYDHKEAVLAECVWQPGQKNFVIDNAASFDLGRYATGNELCEIAYKSQLKWTPAAQYHESNMLVAFDEIKDQMVCFSTDGTSCLQVGDEFNTDLGSTPVTLSLIHI